VDGWRINALYEITPLQGKLIHGVSLGYLKTSGYGTEGQGKYNLETFPIYYAPKILFGKTNFRSYVKGAIGVHISDFKNSFELGSYSDKNIGMTLGCGFGFRYSMNKKIFLSAEYELLYLTKSYYEHNLVNTASAGIGFKF
jgi:hypothetical protein